MKIPNINHIWSQDVQPSIDLRRDLTFRDIYEAINVREDFNEPQLFYLGQLLKRKQKAMHPGTD